MKSLTFRCPRTGLTFHSGIQMERFTLATMQAVSLKLTCRCCAQSRHFSLKDAELAEPDYGYRSPGPLTPEVLTVY